MRPSIASSWCTRALDLRNHALRHIGTFSIRIERYPSAMTSPAVRESGPVLRVVLYRVRSHVTSHVHASPQKLELLKQIDNLRKVLTSYADLLQQLK